MSSSGCTGEARGAHAGRPMTMIDAMILIAGLAVRRGVFAIHIMQDRSFRNSPQWYYFQALGTTALLVPLSLSLLVMASRKPRPPVRWTLDSPAMIVGLSALVVFAINTAILLLFMSLVGLSKFSFAGGSSIYFGRMLAEQTGMCLLVAWCSRAIAGRCRGPVGCGWLDRLGWAIGSCWVLLAIGSLLFTLI